MTRRRASIQSMVNKIKPLEDKIAAISKELLTTRGSVPIHILFGKRSILAGNLYILTQKIEKAKNAKNIEDAVWTEKLLETLISNEDAIDAYKGGYYDTHDLDYIGRHLDEYKEQIETYRKLLPTSNCFSSYYVKNGKLILKK